MIRITILEIASFFLPFLIFFIWRWQSNTETPIKATHNLQLAAAGAGLALIVLTALVMLESREGRHETELYVPPALVDGQVVPGHYVPAGSTQTPEDEPDAASEPQ